MTEFLKTDAIAIIALIQPWLIAVWKKFFRRPKIEIYPSGTLEIGYSEYGPTVGFHGTLNALHGDVFVKRIRIKIKRIQTNEEHWFSWVAFRSPAIAFNPLELPPMELPASFIVSRSQPHRYNIVFYDPIVQNEIRPYLEKLVPVVFAVKQNYGLDFIRGTVGWNDAYQAAHEEYTQKQEQRDAYDKLTRSCYWQAGRYELEVHIDSNMGDSKFRKQLTFSLTEAEVQRLLLNSVVMLENPFRIMAGEQLWNFNFIYRAFEEAS